VRIEVVAEEDIVEDMAAAAEDMAVAEVGTGEVAVEEEEEIAVAVAVMADAGMTTVRIEAEEIGNF